MEPDDSVDIAPVLKFLKGALRKAVPVPDAISAAIDLCERQRRHRDWAKLRKLKIGADLVHLETWVRRMFKRDPPGVDVTGLWFGMSNPGRRLVTADLYHAGAVPMLSLPCASLTRRWPLPIWHAQFRERWFKEFASAYWGLDSILAICTCLAP